MVLVRSFACRVIQVSLRQYFHVLAKYVLMCLLTMFDDFITSL